VSAAREALHGFEPKKYDDTIAGQTIAALGTKPILHMRAFQRGGALSEELLADLRGRQGS
jgi:quinolinate synthase